MIPGRLRDKPETRAMLAAVALGVAVGVGAAFHLAKPTPAAMGWFTFCAFIIGNGMRRR